MDSHFMLKLRAKTQPRQSFHLPNKVLQLKTSSNDRLAIGRTSSNFRNHSQQSPTKKLRLFSIAISRRFEPDNNITISCDDLIQSKNNIRKVLKHFTPINQDRKAKGNLIIQRMHIDRKLSDRSKSQNENDLVQKLKRSFFVGEQIHDFRSELQQKFSATRTLFRAQNKVKNMDRINKIYQRKHLILKKLNQQQDVNPMKGTEQERFSPWHKYRSLRNGIRQSEQNGDIEELF